MVTTHKFLFPTHTLLLSSNLAYQTALHFLYLNVSLKAHIEYVKKVTHDLIYTK